MNRRLNISQWAEEDRPREKMERLGAEALSNAELLAILIGSGSTKESAVDLMKRVMNDCNNSLNALGKKSVGDLCSYDGLGPAKAISILAACEIGKRRQMESPLERPQLGTATRIYNYLHPRLQDKQTEEFWAIYLNQDMRVLKDVCISRGGITMVTVDIRVILREALLSGATVVAVAHNHPSGNVSPSREDDGITRQISRACDVMNLRFMDHVIIADGIYFSYHEAGRL